MVTEKRLEKMKKVLKHRLDNFCIVLDEIYDPFNISAILRTCDGLGIKDIYIVKPPSGFKPSKSVCMRCDKWLKIKKSDSRLEIYSELKDKGYKIYGTVLRDGSKNFLDFGYDEKTAIVLGNEHSGLCKEAINLCDQLIHIPMFGFVQSFNVSVSAAIILSNIVFNKKHSRKSYISADIQEKILSKWIKKL